MAGTVWGREHEVIGVSLRPRLPDEVPAQPAEVGRPAFPKGCLHMRIRDAVGPLFPDEDFVDLSPQRGQPAWPAHRLALMSVLQFVEGLSDRQAATAVRGRIDWKFLLGLELILDRLREASLLVRPGGRRTDSTHALNTLAASAPGWPLQAAPADWFDRYQRRIEDYRLPRGEGPGPRTRTWSRPASTAYGY